jgi:D-lactate dehydrogenase (cytochrome)
MEHGVRARAPRDPVVLPPTTEVTERWLVDAAYFPGGRAEHVFLPRTEGEVAAVVRAHHPVLALGAQSSLTGGATPVGGAVLATERLDGLELQENRARCGAGVALTRVQEAARDAGLFLAPAPTYDGAFAGGAVATNAAGAATFKYGTIRDAVTALTVVLADGSVLDLERGRATAHADGWFEIGRTSGAITRVPLPTYRDPQVPKCSAGYHAAPGMDLVDLFVGSEGTLGIVTEVEFELEPRPAASLVCWLPLASESRGLEVVKRLRDASRATWLTGDPAGLDVPAIEHIDQRSVELLIEDGEDRKHGIPLDPRDGVILFFALELASEPSLDDTIDQLSGESAADTPLTRLMALLGDDAERLEAALPGEAKKAGRFAALREAVPMCVNHRVRDARAIHPGVHKVAGDFIVPFEHVAESFAVYREQFRKRGLDHAIWGHIGDGNVHPNVIPQSAGDVAAGKEAILVMGERVVALGGSPLAEHGVGRHPIKQQLLRNLRGERGIDEMRAVKRALDPDWKLAPGVLFPVP